MTKYKKNKEIKKNKEEKKIKKEKMKKTATILIQC